MEFSERKQGPAVVVSPIGRLDPSGAQALEIRVADVVGRGEPAVVLDCSRISYVASSGLRALLLSTRICQQGGGDLTVAALRPDCRRVVEVSGLLAFLDYHETVPAALAARDREGRLGKRKPAGRPGRTAMTIGERKDRSAIVLFPVGRLNRVGARVLEARVSDVVARGEVRLALDCVGMSYVSSIGLRALLRCAKLCQHEGGRLVMARLQPECRSVLGMSGFLSVIDHHETSEAALASLA